MTDPASHFHSLVNQHDETKKYEPAGPRPVVAAPDLEIFRETSNATDRALADGFFRHYRHLFCNGDGSLYVYHAERGAWSRDNVDKQILAYCMHLSDHFHDELIAIRAEIADARAAGRDIEQLSARQTATTRLILHCEKANTMGAVARLLTSKLTALMADRPQKMNPDGALLACSNGVVDLRTGELRWPVPGDYITRNTETRYKADIGVQWWEDVVLAACGGNPRLAEFLQVWLGYCATGHTNEHAMAILWGSGRNGKNLIVDSVAAALGRYASALPASFMEAMGDQTNMDNNMLFAMAQLDGVRMAYVSETGEKGKMKESWVKSQTGDRKQRARLARQDFYEFDVTHKLTIGTNHKPEITGTDDGVWERIRLVPMRVRFGTQEEVDSGIAQALADRGLLARATTAEGRETVLKWVVEGARKYLAGGLRRYTPPEIQAETMGYRREQDVLGQFLQDATEYIAPPDVKRVQEVEQYVQRSPWRDWTMHDRMRIERMTLWGAYCMWCEEHGHHPMSATMFARRITGSQRFWTLDEGERVMPHLEAIKVNGQGFYRYVRFSDNGLRLKNKHEYQSERRERKPSDNGDM